MRGITISVDYADLLEITLPYNRHHFSKFVVVTSPSDRRTIEVAAKWQCEIHKTNVFWRNGADFNKWAALEEGLDVLGRVGWITIMDADILWPRQLPKEKKLFGNLYTPLCHIMRGPATIDDIPKESEWDEFPLRRNQSEWAGYSLIFHAGDSVLGEPPWFEQNWKHAGGADSVFQNKWPKEKKIRPSWNCFHIGSGGQNWCGRSTPYLNGDVHPNAEQRKQKVLDYIANRASCPKDDKWRDEKF